MSIKAVLHRMRGAVASRLPGAGPMVLVDGRPRADLWVRRLRMTAPLDLRDAELVMRREGIAASAGERGRAERLLGARIDVVQPVALAGAESRLLPLLCGRIVSVREDSAGRTDEMVLSATCDWRRELERVITADELRMPGGAWTVGGFLRRLSVIGQLDLDLSLVPGGVLSRAMRATHPAGATIGQALASLLESERLVVQRRITWRQQSAVEQRTLRSLDTGRPIRLALGDVANPAGAVERITGASAARRPVKLIATADGQQVESTFTLVGAWDSSLESRDDGEYVRSASSDFDAVSNVFRCWVLNEDGAYSKAPFNRGPAFPLTDFFGEGRVIPPQAIAFGPALSMDEGGRSLGVVVEYSLDSGANWQRYGGLVNVLADRAGVYFDDDELPGALLSAVRAGTGRVRITATLRSPLPLEHVRWRGNPFTGGARERRYTLGRRFAHRRLDPAGKYYEQVRTGERQADTADDRAAMAVWLAEQPVTGDARGTKAVIETAVPMIALRIGDRLEMLAGRGIGIDMRDPRSGGPAAWLREIEHRWDGSPSRLEWELEGGGA